MHRPRIERRGAFTLVEVLTVIVIIVVLLGLLMVGLLGARRSGQQVACTSNIRQLGLGFKHYGQENHDVLPSVHTNIWTIVGQYVGQRFNAGSDLSFANNRNQDIGNVYRCPSDDFRRGTPQACSYAPNFEDAPDTAATGTGGSDERNWRFSPWSNFKLDESKNPVANPAGTGFLRVRTLGEAAPDTILLVDCWHPSNQIDVTGYQKTPMAPIHSYVGAAAKATIGSAADAGTYQMLEMFGTRADARGRAVTVRGDVIHSGRVSVFCADARAEPWDVQDLTQRSPATIQMWTREKD